MLLTTGKQKTVWQSTHIVAWSPSNTFRSRLILSPINSWLMLFRAAAPRLPLAVWIHSSSSQFRPFRPFGQFGPFGVSGAFFIFDLWVCGGVPCGILPFWNNWHDMVQPALGQLRVIGAYQLVHRHLMLPAVNTEDPAVPAAYMWHTVGRH